MSRGIQNPNRPVIVSRAWVSHVVDALLHIVDIVRRCTFAGGILSAGNIDEVGNRCRIGGSVSVVGPCGHVIDDLLAVGVRDGTPALSLRLRHSLTIIFAAVADTDCQNLDCEKQNWQELHCDWLEIIMIT